MSIRVTAGTPAEVIDAAMTETLGSSAANALKFHIARMAGVGDASALAVEDPDAFEEVAARLFGAGSAALLNRLAAYLFRSIVPASRSGPPDYAVKGSFGEHVRQLRGAYIIKNAVLEMKDRDHVIAYYSSPFQLEQMVYHFVVRGLQNNQVTFMAVSRQEERAFREFLWANGMDADSLVKRGDIVTVSHDELYPEGLDPSIEPILARLYAARAEIKSRKRAGLNIIGTVAGNLALRGEDDRCLRLEQAWHRTVQDYAVPVTLLCPYSADVMTAESRAMLIECHSRSVRPPL